MKFSIRFSILSLFLLLIGFIGSVIIISDYHTFDKILIESAKNSISHSSKHLAYQIFDHLQPLNERGKLAAEFIESKLVTPGSSKAFRKFLINLIKDNPDIYGAYWADIYGNLYLIENNGQGVWISEEMLRNIKNPVSIHGKSDKDGKLIKKEIEEKITFDARTRPWYQRTKYKKQHMWSIYPFKGFQGKKEVLGITSTYPIYDKDKKLTGMFSMDMTLGALSKFISRLRITNNSIAFICDRHGRLMNAYSLNVPLTVTYTMPRIKNLNLPWAEKSFELYKKNRKSTFIYKIHNKEYIASYREIANPSGSEWYVAIVTPINDIIGVLKQNTIRSIIIAVIVLLLGLIGVIFISTGVSSPIRKLVVEADKIRKFQLTKGKQIKSYIIEIIDMKNAFDAMRSSLQSFQRYVPVTLVKNLITKGEVARVGGELKEMSFLFSDIEGFTSISENMKPQELMNYLSEYLEVITRVIIEQQGTLDKYVGDEVMAFWGAPLSDAEHAFHACNCALLLDKALKEVNKKWKAEGKGEIKTRIGINTGNAIVGNVGSTERLNYTAIGDSVNLASRVESLNKLYNTYLMVGERTYEQVKEQFNFRLLDHVAVKGKKEGVHVYELLTEDRNFFNSDLKRYNEEFAEAFNAYHLGNWDNAIILFEKIKSTYQEDQLLDLYLERCRLLKNQKGKKWNGIWVMETK